MQSQGNYEEAIRVYKAIALDKPKDDTVFYNLGTALQSSGGLAYVAQLG